MLRIVFFSLLAIGISTSLFIVLVIILRKITKQRCNRTLCVLWSLVAIRLMVPFTVSDIPSLHNSLSETLTISVPIEENNKGIATTQYRNANDGQQSVRSDLKNTKQKRIDAFLSAGSLIWLIGVTILLEYQLVSARRLRRKLAMGVEENGVVVCDQIGVPMVFGLFRTRIYVPSDLHKECLNDVIAHERMHIQNKDHFRKVLFTIIASVYWFHPLVWIAFFLYSRDLEMACDDAVVERMTHDEKKHYVSSILTCGRIEQMGKALSVGFSNGSIKERVMNIMREKRKSPKMRIVYLTTGVCALAVTLLFGFKRASMKDTSSDVVELGVNKVTEGFLAKPDDYDLVVFVWESYADTYRCVSVPVSNDPKTMYNEAMSKVVKRNGITPEAMKIILATSGIQKDRIDVVPYVDPISSYAGHTYVSEEDEKEYIEFLRGMLFD